MTSPAERIRVECPGCRVRFETWHRASINLDLEGWDPADPDVQAYLREAATATCPACGFVVEIGTLVVRDDVWTFTGERSAT